LRRWTAQGAGGCNKSARQASIATGPVGRRAAAWVIAFPGRPTSGDPARHATPTVTGRCSIMPYELRAKGRQAEHYETAEEAETRARALIRADADLQVEVIDLATGRPYAPAADPADREQLSRKIGF